MHPLLEPSYRPTEGRATRSLRRTRGRSSALPVTAVRPPHGGPCGHGDAHSPSRPRSVRHGAASGVPRPQRTLPTSREPCGDCGDGGGKAPRSPPASPAVSRGDLATSDSAFRGGEPHRPPVGSQGGREELRSDSPTPPSPAGCITWGRPSRPRSPCELTWCRARRCQSSQPAPPRAEGSPGSARAPLRGGGGEEGVAARFPPPGWTHLAGAGRRAGGSRSDASASRERPRCLWGDGRVPQPVRELPG